VGHGPVILLGKRKFKQRTISYRFSPVNIRIFTPISESIEFHWNLKEAWIRKHVDQPGFGDLLRHTSG